MIEKRKPGRPKKQQAVDIPIKVEIAAQGFVSTAQIGPEALRNAPQGEIRPHKYEYTVAKPEMVPAAFCDEAGNLCEKAIDSHLQRCYDIGTAPVINGLLIGEKV